MRIRLSALLLALFLLLPGCAARKSGGDIAATTGPVAEFAHAITEGTGLTVTRLITDSVSCLHDYSLSVRQMEAVEESQVVLISGAGLEDFMSDVLSHAKTVVDCSKGIDLLENSEGTDPHIWLDPARAQQMVDNLTAGLTAIYPEHEAAFAENATVFKARLQALDEAGKKALSDISCRELITFHDGFGYLASHFDLTILAAIEEEAGAEASAASLTEIIDLVKAHHLPAVFTEANGSDAAASVIESETGVPHFALDLGFGDRDYFSAMEYNFETLKEALT